jgi:hypothetical protein
MLGTPYYMSPEQWGELPEDGNSDIDGRADIYSLGVVFYEIVAGKRPFSGVTILELRKQHVSETPKPLHEVTPGVSANFSKAIQRAMAKDRDARQATAGDLEKELETGLDGAGAVSAAIPATIVGPPPSDGRFATMADRPTPTVDDTASMTILDGGAEVSPSVPSQAATMPTVVVSAEELAAREAAKARQTPQAIPQPRVDVPAPKKRSPLILIGAIVVVLLIVIGAGGFGLWRYLSSRGANPPAKTATTDANTATSDTSAPLHEVARYWVEVNTENSGDSNRAGELISMRSGQELKFHFSPSENGYLYIIGPGAKNAPTIFLSGEPGPVSGLETNEVKSGANFSFPEDTMLKANFIRLDETPGTDEFMFVFSPAAITTPAFFAGPSQHQLTADELNQWNDFQTQAKANAATIEVIKTGASPQAAVKMPQNAPENASVVFRVRIEHR